MADSFSALLGRLAEAHERELQEGLAGLRAELSSLRSGNTGGGGGEDDATMQFEEECMMKTSGCGPALPTTALPAPAAALPSSQAAVPPPHSPPQEAPDAEVRQPSREPVRLTLPSTVAPEEKVEEEAAGPHSLRICIVGARGLRNADLRILGGGKSDPYCICEVLGKPETKIRTEAIDDTTEPTWDHWAKIPEFAKDDTLVFTVWDKDRFKHDDFLGRAMVAGDTLGAAGFEGDLQLSEAGEGIKAYLRIRIEPSDVFRKRLQRGHSVDTMISSASSEREDFALRTVWSAPLSPQAAIHRPSLRNPNSSTEATSSTDHTVHTSSGVIRHFISPPGSAYRLAWDLLGGLLILYDSIAIPLQQVFNLPDTALLLVMDCFTLAFWTVNMFMSALVGYIRKGITEMRFSRILSAYLKSWFLVDLAVVVPDWYFTLSALASLDASQPGGSTVKLLRVVRLVRTVRLIRLLKLRWILAALNDLLNSESASIMANIVKMITMLLFINHFIACFWFLISDLQRGTSPTWIEGHGFEGATWDYQYLTAMHWSITQFTPASMDVQPHNATERAFTILVVVGALVGFSYLVGSITNSLTQLRSMQEDASKQFWNVRRYLKQNQVPMTLSVRIQRYLEHAWQRQRAKVSEPAIFGLLSEQLRNELQCARSVPHMVVHPLFEALEEISHVTLQRLAVNAISRRQLARGDGLFYPGETATHVYFVVLGQLRYIKVDKRGLEHVEWVDSEEDWISEPVLWTQSWTHLGTLLAQTEAELLLVDGGKFGDIISLSPGVFALVRSYARQFLDWINAEFSEDLSDISQGEDISSMLQGFIHTAQAHPSSGTEVSGSRMLRRMKTSKTLLWS